MGKVYDRVQPPQPVVIIDDDLDHAHLLAESLRGKSHDWPGGGGFIISVHGDPVDALANLPVGEPLILCDYCLVGSCALDWMTDFVRAGCGPVILLTSSGNEEIAAQAFRQGVADYIVKSAVFDRPETLIRSMLEALRRHRLERRNLDLSRTLRALNAELLEKNLTLAALTDTAHRFVDDVAHEFRTPLAVIQEFASIISDGIGGDVTPRQAEFLGHIDHACHDLASLIDDFLDTSRLRAQTLRVDRTDHTVADLFAGVRAALEVRGASRQVKVIEQIEPGLPTFFADLEKARRVIVNLAVNAIKFSPEGAEITLFARGGPDDTLEIGVADHGPGIAPAEVAAIFERFRQASEGRRPAVKGFGLGLSISQELVTLNLGRLAVTSALGKGSTFTFTLPTSDRGSIVRHHLDHLCGDGAPGYVAVLEAVPTDPAQPLDEARESVVSCSHPWDLVLPGADGLSLLIVGGTSEPDKWVARLEKEIALAGEHLERARGPLKISVLGCWAPHQARAEVESRARCTPTAPPGGKSRAA